MKICLKCLRHYNNDFNICPMCAKPLEYIEEVPTTEPVQSPAGNTVSKDLSQQNGANESITGVYYPANQQNGIGNPYRTDAPPVYTPAVAHKNNNTVVYVVVAALLVIFASVFLAFFLSMRSQNTPSASPVQNAASSTSAVQQSETTTVKPETTVQQTTTAHNNITGNESAYNTFFNFYCSYLDAINALDASVIDYCTQDVRAEMIERFEYNKKSVFDLRRIDFDEPSYSVTQSGNTKYHSFYVKCVSNYYDRATLVSKEFNYAVWLVTVREYNGSFEVCNLERNDKYKMNEKVYTITDKVTVF